MITWPAALAISRKKIAELKPGTRKKARLWFNACLAAGLLPYVYEGVRTSKKQNELYAIGRTVRKKEAKVTNAKAGQSMHQYGLALDFVCLVPHRKAAGYYEAGWDDEGLYDRAHEIAAKLGLRRLSWETPHLEDADVKDWKDAEARFGPAA